MCGIPVGLKDLYAVAGKPLTASSRLLVETPARSCDVWLRLEAAGAVLLGHTHTHEFAAGGTTDQVGNPWALDRSSGGSSGGSGAALAAHTVPAATGTDTAGSLRIPSALSGVSTIKPTRGHVSLRGIVPLSPSLDHAGPMARSVADCAVVLAAMAGPDGGRSSTALLRPAPELSGSKSLAGIRLAVSPRVGSLEPDVAEGFDRAIDTCRRLGAAIVAPIADVPALDVLDDYMTVLLADMLAYHRRFDGSRDLYRPSIREFIELAEASHAHAEEYVAAEMRRRDVTAHWSDRLAAERVTALLEPTVPVTAPLRGSGYDARALRLRPDLAHALLELDGLSRRRAAVRRRRADRAAGERVARRRARLRLGAARARRRAPGRARRSQPVAAYPELNAGPPPVRGQPGSGADRRSGDPPPDAAPRRAAVQALQAPALGACSR